MHIQHVLLTRFKRAGAAILAVTIAAPALPARANTAPVLIDQRGERFTFSTFAGVPLFVTFVAAHCTDVCPLINAQFSAAARTFAREHRKVHLLTITLDPEHDPPAVMRALAGTFSADPRIWTLASGSLTDVHRVMRAFGVVAQRGRDGYADVHTTFVYLIDARGALRKTILASSNLSAQLVGLAR